MVPPRPSVSPLPSFCTVPAPSPPSMSEMLRSIIRGWRGTRPSFKRQIAEAKLVDALAAEFEAKGAAKTPPPKG